MLPFYIQSSLYYPIVYFRCCVLSCCVDWKVKWRSPFFQRRSPMYTSVWVPCNDNGTPNCWWKILTLSTVLERRIVWDCWTSLCSSVNAVTIPICLMELNLVCPVKIPKLICCPGLIISLHANGLSKHKCKSLAIFTQNSQLVPPSYLENFDF